MSDTCVLHHRYLGALADGELALVPEPTRDHVAECEPCAVEVATHGLLGERLRQALVHDPAPHRQQRSAPRIRRSAAVAAAAAVLLGAGASVTWRHTHGGTDPVVLAVSAAHGQPMLRSTDPAAIRAWCSREAERAGPPVELPALSPIGARMDASDGAQVVTIFYQSAAGGPVAVSWLDSATAAPSRSRVEERSVSGAPVLVLQTPAGEAVLSGGSIASLWLSAATIQTVTG